jgi:hypothetical protein
MYTRKHTRIYAHNKTAVQYASRENKSRVQVGLFAYSLNDIPGVQRRTQGYCHSVNKHTISFIGHLAEFYLDLRLNLHLHVNQLNPVPCVLVKLYIHGKRYRPALHEEEDLRLHLVKLICSACRTSALPTLCANVYMHTWKLTRSTNRE